MIRFVTSRRLCSNFSGLEKVGKKNRNQVQREVTPIALQYIYGDTNKVQSGVRSPDQFVIHSTGVQENKVQRQEDSS